MPMIIRNNIRYATGGGGNTDIVKLTQAEYDALPESKYSDGVLYAITDGESSSGGGTSKPVELTKAQYEALGESVNTDGILYAITDGDELSAKNLVFDDTETQLGVNNVQDAIIEQNKNLGGLRFGVDGDGNGGYYKADDSFVPFKSAKIVVGTGVYSGVVEKNCTIRVAVNNSSAKVTLGGVNKPITAYGQANKDTWYYGLWLTEEFSATKGQTLTAGTSGAGSASGYMIVFI